jgi:hypothetical protein
MKRKEENKKKNKERIKKKIIKNKRKAGEVTPTSVMHKR